MSLLLTPFQLLELNIISAQDLAPVSRSMRTYAVAWVHPDRKLSTRVDTQGHANPTWNDKFVFRVDDEFLRADTSAVMIEIYAVSWFRDVHVGTVRVLVGNLVPPPSRPHHPQPHLGMRFVALQVRRPSGRPQGILNIGVAVLDSSMRSMPLYTQLSTSAVGYRDLMGEGDPHHHHNNNQNQQPPNSKPELRRTRSERSDRRVAFDDELATSQKPASSINGSDLKTAPPKGKVFHDKPVSILNGSDIGYPLKPRSDLSVSKAGTPKIGRPVMGPPAKVNVTTGSVWSELEVGPSPSEIAEDTYNGEEQNSMLEGWSLEGSVEGLRSKLERWRTELPPVYDRGGEFGSFRSSVVAGGSRARARRHTDGGGGLFSCFGNVYGYECSCICGKNTGTKKSGGGRAHVSPSVDSRSYSIA